MFSYSELEQQAIEIAKEDGIYYEWLNHNVTDNEYEYFIENKILELMKKENTMNNNILYFIGYDSAYNPILKELDLNLIPNEYKELFRIKCYENKEDGEKALKEIDDLKNQNQRLKFILDNLDLDGLKINNMLLKHKLKEKDKFLIKILENIKEELILSMNSKNEDLINKKKVFDIIEKPLTDLKNKEVEKIKVPRILNLVDLFTHLMTRSELDETPFNKIWDFYFSNYDLEYNIGNMNTYELKNWLLQEIEKEED